MESWYPRYDFVVVGGGTSGAVVAGNLARSRQKPRVLVIETGGDNQRPDLRVPSDRFVNSIRNPDIRTVFKTTPQCHLGGRVLEYLTGRGLGGSSIANFLAYNRGAASDYNEWASRVDDDYFAWENTLKRFKEIENLHFDGAGHENELVKLKEGAHSTSGLLDISLPSRKDWELGQEKILEAAIEFGWPLCRDPNSGNPIGVGCTTTTTHKGFRVTSGTAYLDRGPPNLDIWCNATATRILFERQPDRKPKAVGVQLADGRVALADKELILSSGAISSPRLLLLSGVGPAAELNNVGIDCVVNQPCVGKNLTDHVWLSVHWSVSPEISDIGAYIADKAAAAVSRKEWLRSHTGPDAYRNLSNLIAFVKFDPKRADLSELEKLPAQAQSWIKKQDVPQIEIYLKAACPEDWNPTSQDEFMGMTIMLMNPQSRGAITLSSKNPSVDCVLDPEYLSHPYDRRTIIDGVREALTFVRSTCLSQYIIEEILVPATDSDEDILRFCEQNLNSVFHGCGTVRMGRESDKTACLDTHFRVRGIDNLRVIDLSAIPLITSNHTTATAFVVGQMGFKRLEAEYRLERQTFGMARL